MVPTISQSWCCATMASYQTGDRVWHPAHGAGTVTAFEGPHPVIQFDGGTTLTIAITSEKLTQAGSVDRDEAIVAAIVVRLRNWRHERAEADRRRPYHIATNAVLDAIARVRPTTLAELARVSGVGPARVERYGAQILACVNDGKDA